MQFCPTATRRRPHEVHFECRHGAGLRALRQRSRARLHREAERLVGVGHRCSRGHPLPRDGEGEEEGAPGQAPLHCSPEVADPFPEPQQLSPKLTLLGLCCFINQKYYGHSMFALLK